jgi:hypothetical protein
MRTYSGVRLVLIRSGEKGFLRGQRPIARVCGTYKRIRGYPRSDNELPVFLRLLRFSTVPEHAQKGEHANPRLADTKFEMTRDLFI